MITRIEVTQEDIDRGIPNVGESCPIALAIGRKIPNAVVFVGQGAIEFNLDDGYSYSRIPERASTFVRKFDASDPVKPFAFKLDIPDELLQLLRASGAKLEGK